MSMLVKYTDNTEEIRYFNTQEAFKWFLGIQFLQDGVKVLGYKKID